MHFFKSKFAIILLFLYGNLQFADSASSSNFSYKAISNKSHKYVDLIDLSYSLMEYGLFELDLKKSGNIIPESIDQIFVSNSKNRNHYAIAKFDIKPSTSLEFINIGKDYVCHTITKSQRNISIFFSEFSEIDARQICNSLKKRTAISQNMKMRLLLDYLFPLARAGTFGPLCDETSPSKSNSASIRTVNDEMQSIHLLQKLGTCAAEAIRTSFTNLGGAATSIQESLDRLRMDPFAFWVEIKAQANATLDFIYGIKEYVQQFAQSLSGLPIDVQWKLGCQLIGEATVLLGGMALTAWTGAGVAAMSIRLIEIFSQIQKTSGALKYIQTLLKSGKLTKANEAISCLVN